MKVEKVAESNETSWDVNFFTLVTEATSGHSLGNLSDNLRFLEGEVCSSEESVEEVAEGGRCRLEEDWGEREGFAGAEERKIGAEG